MSKGVCGNRHRLMLWSLGYAICWADQELKLEDCVKDTDMEE